MPPKTKPVARKKAMPSVKPAVRASENASNNVSAPEDASNNVSVVSNNSPASTTSSTSFLTSPSLPTTLLASSRASRTPGSTVQRILTQSKTLPKYDLQTFGIKAAATGKREHDKNSKLKCVVIAEEGGAATIIFRCEPNNPNNRNGSWSEKAFFDAVRSNVDWVQQINVDNDMLHWWDNDEVQLNMKGYHIRLFQIHCAEYPSEESVLKLGEYICEHINAMPNNTTTISINQVNFFWIPNDYHPVWADVIGTEAALKALLEKKGWPKKNGYYEKHQDTIHTYFRPHTFSFELARALQAPIDQVHPALRAHANEVKAEEDVPNDEVKIKIEPQDDMDSDPDPDL